MMTTTRKNSLKWISLMLVLVLASTAVFFAVAEETKPLATIKEASTVCESPFTAAIEKVHGSVVGVNNYTTYTYSNNYSNPFGNYFGNFFGNGFGYGYGNNGYGNNGYGNNGSGSNESNTRQVLQGYASGVVIADGFVLTNYHVVEDATYLEVTYEDKTYAAQLMGTDEAKDLAVLYVEGLDVEPVVLGDSDNLRVGEWAICIGNPIGFEGSTTVGIISALNREITGSATDTYGKRTTNTMIQTDAAINSGNSGGGMFNVAGELIGIPSLKYSRSSSSSTASIEGIAMAIPVNEAKTLINEVLSGKGNVQNQPAQSTLTNGGKPRIGVTVSQINSNNYAVQNGLIPNGAYVQSVEEGAPAQLAGIQEGDIIVDIDGNVITSTTTMISYLQSKQAGDQVKVKVYRVEGGLNNVQDFSRIPDGEYIDLTVTLALLDNIQQ